MSCYGDKSPCLNNISSAKNSVKYCPRKNILSTSTSVKWNKTISCIRTTLTKIPWKQNPPIHSVHSSSLHLTRLTCLQEVNISPNHQHQHQLPHHHWSHSGGDPIDPNQCLPDHQQRPEALLESTYAGVPVQGRFYSNKKMQLFRTFSKHIKEIAKNYKIAYRSCQRCTNRVRLCGNISMVCIWTPRHQLILRLL